ncbi:hypothetical protein NPX13_g3945 [Xylaria arbuscula]|uniref:Uncharacterized protein n=1 Tax=Xylaria arbuscula TaxID=114810 RepID=A0A9W8NHG7_9PEZI|nr:hypothetical protein NPX13_g3945 [Xylaria arbuscula]
MSEKKVVLITGATNGIGYETAKAFLQSPNNYHIYLGSRSLQKGNTALETLQSECPSERNTVELLQIDLYSDESISKAFERVNIGQGRLDVLINNAAD